MLVDLSLARSLTIIYHDILCVHINPKFKQAYGSCLVFLWSLMGWVLNRMSQMSMSWAGPVT